ncbi:MAG: fibronectin type III domain-containing protein [Desulfobaccales bacterium]
MSKRSDRPPEVAAPVIAGPDFCLVLHRRDACATRIRPKTGTAAAAGYFLLPWFLALTIMCGGCGKKLAPFAPDQLVAGPVREFRLSQEGDSLVLSWLLPKVNLLGQPLTQVQGCRVYRCEVSGVSPEATCPLNFVRCADIDLAYPRQGEVRGEAFIFQDRNLVPDHRYFYRVAAYDQDGYLGGWSPTLSHVWGWLPRPPLDLQATPGDRLAALRWSPVSRLTNGSPARDLKGYLIYRREGSGAWSQISPEPISQTAFQDVAVKNEVEYTYKVLAVRRLGGDLLASADSLLVSARPEKLTPPPPLLGLLAVPTSQGVELRWQPSPAPDVAGYRLYRRSPGEARAVKLTPELLTKPYFVDTGVQRGQTYYYYVTAVDNSPRANESLPSEEAEITY